MKKKNRLLYKIKYMKPFDAFLLISVFVMFLVLLATVSIGTERYKNNQIAFVQDSMDMIADSQREQFEQFINQKVSLLQALVTFPEIYEMDFEQLDTFLTNRSSLLGFHQLFVMRRDGIAYYVEEDICRDQKNDQFFQDVMQNFVFVTEPFYGADATTTTICVTIYNQNKVKVGSLCGAVSLTSIQEMFMDTEMFLNGTSYLINRNGTYIAADDINKVYDKESLFKVKNSDTTLIQSAFEAKADASGTIMLNGIEYQTNVTYLSDLDWAIVQCVKTKDILSDLKYIDMWRYTSFASIGIILICVIRITLRWHMSSKRNTIDALTGCRSRLAMENILNTYEMQHQHSISIVYLDLNKFKYVNDTYGHDVGDQILKMFSDVLVEVFGSEGFVGRMGGDEFMVILIDSSEDLIQRLCHDVQEKLVLTSQQLDFNYIISTSFGHATRGRGADESLTEVMARADEKMYAYKQNHS